MSIPRPQTDMAALAKLRPLFARRRHTAGNAVRNQ